MLPIQVRLFSCAAHAPALLREDDMGCSACMLMRYLPGAGPQLVESSAAVTWAFFAMPAKDLEAAVPIVDVRAPRLPLPCPQLWLQQLSLCAHMHAAMHSAFY